MVLGYRMAAETRGEHKLLGPISERKQKQEHEQLVTRYPQAREERQRTQHSLACLLLMLS